MSKPFYIGRVPWPSSRVFVQTCDVAVFEEVEVNLAQAPHILCRDVVDLGADPLHRVLGDGRHMGPTLFP